MLLAKNERGLYVHRFDQGRFKLLVPARECGDVSHLIGHRVSVVRDVRDTMPDKACRGVRFVQIMHDRGLCSLTGPCFPAQEKRDLAASLVARLEALRSKLEKSGLPALLVRDSIAAVNERIKLATPPAHVDFDGDWMASSWKVGGWDDALGRIQFLLEDPIRILTGRMSPYSQEKDEPILRAWLEKA